MRNAEARVSELHRRMDALSRARRRRFRMARAAAAAGCAALAILVALGAARTPVGVPGTDRSEVAASIFAERGAVGYGMVAIVAFCLGVVLTLFCVTQKKHMKEEKKHDDRRI